MLLAKFYGRPESNFPKLVHQRPKTPKQKKGGGGNRTRKKKGCVERIAPRCTLSQNGYGDLLHVQNGYNAQFLRAYPDRKPCATLPWSKPKPALPLFFFFSLALNRKRPFLFHFWVFWLCFFGGVCLIFLAKNCLRFSICACHPCAGAMLIFSVSFQF